MREKRNALTVIFLGSMFAASLWRIEITIWLLSSPHRVEGCFRLEIAFFIFRWQLSHFLQKARIGIEIWDPFFVLLSISIMLWPSYCVKSLGCPIVFSWIQFLVESLPVFAQPGILRKQTKPLSFFCSNTWEIPHNPLDLNRSMLLLIPARAPFYLSISLLFAFWRSNDMKRTTHPRNQQKKITEMEFYNDFRKQFQFMFSSFYLWCQMQPAPFSVWQWFIIYLPYSQRSRPAKPTCQPHAQCTVYTMHGAVHSFTNLHLKIRSIW